MNFPQKIGLVMIAAAVLATVGHFMGLALPTLRWFYSFEASSHLVQRHPWLENQELIVGLSFCSVLFFLGIISLIRGRSFHWNPMTLRKMERFQSIGRGYLSFLILVILLVLALFDQTLVGKRALAVKYDGKWTFPAFVSTQMSGKDYGLDSNSEPDYRKLKEQWAKQKEQDALVLLPIVPWEPTLDSDDKMPRPLLRQNGKLEEEGKNTPFAGYAVCYYNNEEGGKLRAGRLRNGLPQGNFEVYDEGGEVVGQEEWDQGKRISTTVSELLDIPDEGRWVHEIYMPLPPSLARKHFLGTDSKGWDIVAQLYGGMQIVFKASLLYLLITYGVGITIGSLMGYFGGAFDLVMQRVMEVFMNVPFLLVVMIISANIGRSNITLATIIIIFGVFSWIGVGIYLRTATFKEKARDYVAAAKVLGAGTGRIIFRHILPNALAIIVTLVPFSVSSVITSLTALDFLGFGVPDSYPSWGRLLNDGVDNLSAPWIVSSVFGVMLILLLVITFIGEAVREAFDPKKFTTYE